MIARWIAIVLFTLGLSASDAAPRSDGATTATTAQPIDDRTREILDEVRSLRREHGPITAFTASFVQLKTTPLLTRPIESSGAVRYLDGVTLWETRKPRESTLRVGPGDVRFYYPADRLLEIYTAGPDEQWALIGPQPDFDKVADRFFVASTKEFMAGRDPNDWLALKLTPRPTPDDQPKPFARLELLIDRSNGLVVKATTHDLRGGSTAIEFRRLRTDVKLTPEDVAIVTEPGTRIERFGAQPDQP